jgi:hypothetical protein
MDSGDLCVAIIQEIGAALERKDLQGIRLIAACDAAANEAAFVGVPQASSASVDEVSTIAAVKDGPARCCTDKSCIFRDCVCSTPSTP